MRTGRRRREKALVAFEEKAMREGNGLTKI
jgi:hypothetical protein